MQVTRMDLDGKGKGSPEGLVTAILAAEKNLTIPVPIEELCRQLDIAEIANLETEGFSGALITDTNKSKGAILVKGDLAPQRKRFTIAHELGHFLIPTHMPNMDGRFLCSSDDMRLLGAKENDRRVRMEVEANKFASLILMPPPALRSVMGRFSGADLSHVPQLAKHFDVSKEAAARKYAEFHDERVAVVVVKDGKVDRIYKNLAFPRISIDHGQSIPRGSLFDRASKKPGDLSDIEEMDTVTWLETKWGEAAPKLREQVYAQQNGYALIMLVADIAEEDEDEQNDERTAKERYRDRQSKWRL